jgi:hypothetical protein
MPADDLAKRRRSPLNIRQQLEPPLSFPELDWGSEPPPDDGPIGRAASDDDRHFDFGLVKPASSGSSSTAAALADPPGGIAALMTEKGLGPSAVRTLSQPARRWLLSIPRRHRPRMLAQRYPHVVNKLTIMWGDRQLVEDYFADLIVDHRGGRRGFPSEVTAEILRLHGYFLGLMDPVLRPVVLDEVNDIAGEEITRPMPLPVRWR